MYFDHAKATLKSARHGCLVSVAALFAIAAAGPGPAGASTVDVFLIASHTSPTTSSAAPFTLETSSVYQLGNLNGNKNATTATLVNNFTFDVGAALTYNSHNIPRLDAGETGAGTAALADSEVGTWDDVGITGSGGVDKLLNVGRNAWVTFNSVVGGFTDLILAESGGLTPFKLSLCPDAVCSSIELIFAGFKDSTVGNFLLDLPEFAANESSDQGEMDQAYLFRFSEPIFDYVRVMEYGDRFKYTGNRLAVDFIGVGGSAPVSLAPVPGPAGLPLLATGFALLGWLRSRKAAH